VYIDQLTTSLFPSHGSVINYAVTDLISPKYRSIIDYLPTLVPSSRIYSNNAFVMAAI